MLQRAKSSKRGRDSFFFLGAIRDLAQIKSECVFANVSIDFISASLVTCITKPVNLNFDNLIN